MLWIISVQASSALLTLQESNMKPGRVVNNAGKYTPHKNAQVPVSKKPGNLLSFVLYLVLN